MPSISALVQSISLDVTRELVYAGIVNPAWDAIAIVSATVATPIVVTLANPPSINYAIHVVIEGCAGMTEANGTWILTPTAPGASTFTLTTYFSESQNQYVSVLQNSVGAHAYTGGGTVTTALTDGRIVLGQQHRNETSSPPRVIFTPTTSRFYGSDTNDRRQGGGRQSAGPNKGQVPEMLLEEQARMIAGEMVHFEVTCWGAASPPTPPALPDPDLDFDATQVIYQQVARTLFYLLEGGYALGVGRWVDSQESKTQLAKLGRKMIFPLDIATPVLDYILGSTKLLSITASAQLLAPDNELPEAAWTGTVT